jgi:hypothetical protein
MKPAVAHLLDADHDVSTQRKEDSNAVTTTP